TIDRVANHTDELITEIQVTLNGTTIVVSQLGDAVTVLLDKLYLLIFWTLIIVIPEGYSNSYPNTSYKSFQTMINDSYIRRGDEEATPTEYRGLTSFLSENTFIATTVMGIGFGMDAVFGNNLPVLTGIAMIPAAISILLILPLRETPKFLLLNRKDRNAAMESLKFYR
ncbi:hypothetical protein TELCIR_15836, partial [Teladorsagia circumcincta]